MPISGTGIDIVEISRIKKLMEKDNRLKNRVFTENEVRYCEKKRKKYHHYAVRFAAKEAVWKALGKGGVGLKNIEIRKSAEDRKSSNDRKSSQDLKKNKHQKLPFDTKQN
ncbi:holo-ACP synthase, partial [bacterium]|nr:holo-ACP synthase [bacterium]